MAAINETGIVNLPCAAVAIYEGYLYITPTAMTKQTTVATAVYGIAVESSIDDEGNAKTLAAGQKMPFYLPGCGKIVKVASATGQTWNVGEAAYAGQSATADGCVETSNSNSAILIGHYFGVEAGTTTVDGQLVPILLDAPIGGV
jgi:hypothetical protein